MTTRHGTPIGRRLRSLYSWHRWLGVAAALFVLLFAFTGLALNHSTRLGLDHSYLQHPLWQRLYNNGQTIEVLGLQRDGHWLSQADGRLYLDTRFITYGPAPVDALWLDEFWVVATHAELLLVGPQGELLERITAEQLPGRILGIERLAAQLRLHTPYADFIGDTERLNWQPVARQNRPAPAQTNSPGAEIAEAIKADIRAHSITAERLLLDLHSGHLFGLIGVVIMDSAAIALIALGLSGLLLWLRYRNKQQKRRRQARQKRREAARARRG